MVPIIAVPGRRSQRCAGVRTEAVAAGRRYLAALQRAGAEGAVLLPDPALIDHLPGVLARVDGLLLLGGGDVDPACYGVDADPSVLRGVEPVHDRVELAAVRAALELGLPVLAVCRGLQVLNVALGGTLQVDLTGVTAVEHWDHEHRVTLRAGSRTAMAMGTTCPLVASFHHQAIDRLADGLEVTGQAEDDTIEAVELDGPAWVVGVQWHPEDRADHDPEHQGLFAAFAAAARVRAAR